MLDRIKELLGLGNTETEKLRIEKIRPSWNETFLCEALWWSLKSHDPQTQCGCVLTAPDNTILSTGYNGFIRDIHDEHLPNVRPYKYDFMMHAEHNAVLNCARQGKSTLGATAYVTGEPCNNCLQYMWQAGVNKVVYSDFNDPAMLKDPKIKGVRGSLLFLMNKPFEQWPEFHRMKMVYVPAKTLNIHHLKEFLEKFERAQAKD